MGSEDKVPVISHWTLDVSYCTAAENTQHSHTWLSPLSEVTMMLMMLNVCQLWMEWTKPNRDNNWAGVFNEADETNKQY